METYNDRGGGLTPLDFEGRVGYASPGQGGKPPSYAQNRSDPKRNLQLSPASAPKYVALARRCHRCGDTAELEVRRLLPAWRTAWRSLRVQTASIIAKAQKDLYLGTLAWGNANSGHSLV